MKPTADQQEAIVGILVGGVLVILISIFLIGLFDILLWFAGRAPLP